MRTAVAIAHEIAAEIGEKPGVQAVWLAGSHARGDAGPHSDLDVGVIAVRRGIAPGYRLQERSGHLVSVSWTTAEATRRSFEDPGVLGAAVPGWCRAIILHDTEGTAAGLVAAAKAWTWDAVAERCDRWVAEQATGYAEEVQKLANSLLAGRRLTAAVQRNVLANRLAFVMSVHRRILYDTENALWDLVSRAMGAEWTAAQEAAFGLRGESLSESLRAALQLYLIAAGEAAPLLDDRQRRVVARALVVAREVIAGG
jgi:hypothetical protein